ncbi:MAG: hypothetical protein ABL888_12915 [Pirellulaceae bacterium]
MSKKLRDKITGKPSEERSIDEVFENIFEMAEVMPAAVREATKGGTAGVIKVSRSLFLELLEEASKVHFMKLQVIRHTRKLSKQEREIFTRLDDVEWDELVRIARKMIDSFRSTNIHTRRGGIASLKGKLAEMVFYRSDTFNLVFKKAEDLVDAINLKSDVQILKETITLKKDVRAFSLSKDGTTVSTELTDGLIVAERKDGDFQILAIVEMKSRSNRNDLVRRKSRDFELEEELEDNVIFTREGQLEADIERLSELDLEFDGEFVPAETARFSRHNTMWIGVTPSDVELSQLQLERIKPLISNFQQFRQRPLADRDLHEVVDALVGYR